MHRRHGCEVQRHIHGQAARLPYVKARGNLWLYKWTLYTHTGALVRQLWDGKSRIVVHLVVAKINLSKREKA